MRSISSSLAKVCVCLLAVCGAFVAEVNAKPYKGAELFTSNSTQYGKFVMRMRAAKASGVISNFFLWKDGSELESIFWEEVDVEVFGKDNATSWQSNIITGLGTKAHSEQIHTQNDSFGDGYYTFTIEWTPNQVRWLVDGKVIRTTNGGQASDLVSAAQLRINFWPPAIPEWVGNWNDNVLPQHMYVNWVEFYSWSNGNFKLEWRDDFDYFDQGRWGLADWTFAENRADFSPKNVVVKDGYLVLAMTREGQEGYQGTPPMDNARSSSSQASSSSAASSSIRSSSSSIRSSSSSVYSSSSVPVVSSSSVASSVVASSSQQAQSSAPSQSSSSAQTTSSAASSTPANPIKLGAFTWLDLFCLMIGVVGLRSLSRLKAKHHKL